MIGGLGLLGDIGTLGSLVYAPPGGPAPGTTLLGNDDGSVSLTNDDGTIDLTPQ